MNFIGPAESLPRVNNLLVRDWLIVAVPDKLFCSFLSSRMILRPWVHLRVLLPKYQYHTMYSHPVPSAESPADLALRHAKAPAWLLSGWCDNNAMFFVSYL